MSEAESTEPSDLIVSKYYEYQEYLFEQEEWECYKESKHSKGGRTVINEPFLIMELNRLVPYLENNRVKFHPINMPYIKIGKIEVVGIVTNVKEDSKFYQVQVNDGTGLLVIFYEKAHYKSDLQKQKDITAKYKSRAGKLSDTTYQNSNSLPMHFPKPRPRFKYPPNTSLQSMATLEHRWWLEIRKGLLGKKIECFDYVHAVGYCTLDFLFGKKPQEEITFKELSVAKLNFRATKLDCIEEAEYNCKLISWLTDIIQKRYETEEADEGDT